MRKTPSQKGIHALFTPRSVRSRRNMFLGLVIASLGTIVWAWALLIFTGSASSPVWVDKTLLSVILLSTALPLIVVGSTAFVHSRTIRNLDLFDDVVPGEEEIEKIERPTSLPSLGGAMPGMRRKVSRLQILALLEGVLVVLLYLSLLREYDSSASMQTWIRDNFPLATLLLNDNLVFLAVGILLSSFLFYAIDRRKDV